jgi:predicted RNase H-like HicB family nuclease
MILSYRVLFSRDPQTKSVVAEIPVLGIADHGADLPETLDRLRDMISFHLECLQEEGKPIPRDPGEEEGLYLRVRLPAHAA